MLADELVGDLCRELSFLRIDQVVSVHVTYVDGTAVNLRRPPA